MHDICKFIQARAIPNQPGAVTRRSPEKRVRKVTHIARGDLEDKARKNGDARQARLEEGASPDRSFA